MSRSEKTKAKPQAAEAAQRDRQATDAFEAGGEREHRAPALEPGQLEPEADAQAHPLDLEFILDIPLQVKVEIGRTRLMIQELLQLTRGSVIELDKMLGEHFEVMVNDKLIARGEVVIVNDRFGIRLTDIISPNDRVKSLHDRGR